MTMFNHFAFRVIRLKEQRKLNMWEREYRDLASVPRWSIIRQIHQQSVAEHSFYVALYAEQLSRYLDWQGDKAALMYCALTHDLEECFTGDIVGPAKKYFVDKEKHHEYICTELNKRFNLQYRQLGEQEEEEITSLIKLADGLDEIFYLAGEIQMGNASVSEVFASRIGWLDAKWQEILINVFKKSSEESRSKWRAIVEIIKTHKDECSRVVV